MVTTIGIDPHKATHTAVAIDETATVLGEITVAADRNQTAGRRTQSSLTTPSWQVVAEVRRPGMALLARSLLAVSR